MHCCSTINVVVCLPPGPQPVKGPFYLTGIPLRSAKMAAMACPKNEPSVLSEVDPFEECIVMHVVYANVVIKSQQRDDPELSVEEKISYLVDLLKNKPATFLSRFGRLLNDGHLTYFDGLDEPNIKQKLGEFRGRLNPKKARSTVKNRRYVHMLHLMEKGTYFSEEEMRLRNPLLYEYYIGQYLTEDERESLNVQSTEVLLSARLLQRVDRDACAEKLVEQLNQEEGQVEETDSDDEDSDQEEMSHFNVVSSNKRWGIENIKLSQDPNVADRERRMLRKEFLQIMQQSFLAGKDEAFDYSSVDDDTNLDVSNIQDLDDQEAYFDAEEPSFVDTSITYDTPTDMVGTPTDIVDTPTDQSTTMPNGVQNIAEMETETN